MELYEQENGIQAAGAGTTILSDAYNAASTREIQKFMEFLKQGGEKYKKLIEFVDNPTNYGNQPPTIPRVFLELSGVIDRGKKYLANRLLCEW